MIIWSGLGFLVPVIGCAALLFTGLISEKIAGDAQFVQQHGWLSGVGMLVAAPLTYGFHRLLLLQKGRVVIDKETGHEVVLRSKHSLFFVPVKWWPVVFAVLGVVFVAGGAAQ